jgi:hypothetical protein
MVTGLWNLACGTESGAKENCLEPVTKVFRPRREANGGGRSSSWSPSREGREGTDLAEGVDGPTSCSEDVEDDDKEPSASSANLPADDE